MLRSTSRRVAVVAANADAPVSAEKGSGSSRAYGCIACHAIDNSSLTKLGPTWKGFYGSERTFAAASCGWSPTTHVHLAQSISEPGRENRRRVRTRRSQHAQLCSGVLTDAQVESLILVHQEPDGKSVS